MVVEWGTGIRDLGGEVVMDNDKVQRVALGKAN